MRSISIINKIDTPGVFSLFGFEYSYRLTTGRVSGDGVEASGQLVRAQLLCFVLGCDEMVAINLTGLHLVLRPNRSGKRAEREERLLRGWCGGFGN